MEGLRDLIIMRKDLIHRMVWIIVTLKLLLRFKNIKLHE